MGTCASPVEEESRDSHGEQAKKQKDEDAKKKGNKNRFPKGKAFTTMGAWLEELERRQNLLGGKIIGSGKHAFARAL